MGAHNWSYFVPYQEDVDAALQALREREFRAGRYNMKWSDRYADEPASIKEVMRRCGEEGSRSILDMFAVSDVPGPCTVTPLSESDLVRLFGTDKPTRAMVEANTAPTSRRSLFEEIERGQGVYLVVYDGATPSELFFAGYSFD